MNTIDTSAVTPVAEPESDSSKGRFVMEYDPASGGFTASITGLIPHDAIIAAMQKMMFKLCAANEMNDAVQNTQAQQRQVQVHGNMPMPPNFRQRR